MKKYLATICAALLCVCCLGLAACGGGGSGSAASASASSSSAQVVNVAGEWKLAAAEMQGVTVAGDFSQILGTQAGASLNLKEDGTGTFVMAENSADVKWTQSGENVTLSVTANGKTSDINCTIDGEALKVKMEDQTMNGVLIFTKDGTYAAAEIIDTSKAQPITVEADLVGTWKLSGAKMMGMSMYGDAAAIASVVGQSSDTSLTFEPGGKATFMGTEATYAVSSSGATITLSGVSIDLKSLNDELVIDMGKAAGMDMAFLFSK